MRRAMAGILLAVAIAGCASGRADTEAASCVEEYSLKTLADRRFAFDGTVTSIQSGEYNANAGATPLHITFDVHQWFRGGKGGEATLEGWDFTALAQGTRVLVSGDTDTAWGCGFTRAYTIDEASQWEAAFND